MLNPLKKTRVECEQFVGSLEQNANGEVLAEVLRGHAAVCKDCETALKTFTESRALLSALSPQAEESRPWFAPRVMAAIAARESEMRRSLDAWSVVPKLAARLTWVSALALVLASTWLFGRPASMPVTQPVATDMTGEPVHETITPANSDDLLFSLAEAGS
jgi:hypothetical protein